MIGNLTEEEERIILEFKKRISDTFPDKILRVLLYGSKARGDDSVDSDIDIMVITRENDWRLGDDIRKIGYELDEPLDYRFSIQVIPETRIKYMQENNFQFARNFLNDGITL